MTRPTVALVESPAQLLHLLEWVHHEDNAEDVLAVVLAPREPTSMAQLRTMLTFAEEEEIELLWQEPRRSSVAWFQTLATVAPLVSQARRLVIGDPFSGLIQALLVAAHPREAVVVDDGTATMEFASQLGARKPLQRWDAPTTPRSLLRAPLADHARRFFEAEHVRLFTVMPVTGLPPSKTQRHGYDWTRRRFGTPQVVPGLDIIGSSLAESKVVRRRAYVTAVSALVATAQGPCRYLAHRKEDPDKLAEIAALGVDVCRPEVPVEIELRRGPTATRLASFPSSVGYTLPLVLAGLPTRIEPQSVPTTMFLPEVGLGARRFLERIATDMHVIAGSSARVAPISALG
ncbi:MAG: hypothetical protein CVT62_07170 [Actinobacteria bacterium HGW-Actinobacteria-2]|nr:MAG: hypothetical protein CVT62_07170 [Actinobacteria bacterium HGW-Actinobacteria-2]